jgi:large conductance mechanosensitive channel
MGFFQEFKEFAVKGNVVDMAVGVIIGAAFGKIVTSMVNDLMMPLIGLLLQGRKVDGLFVALDGNSYANIEEATKAGAAVLKYGAFLQTVLDFLIVAFCIFLVIRQMNKLVKKPEPAK